MHSHCDLSHPWSFWKCSFFFGETSWLFVRRRSCCFFGVDRYESSFARGGYKSVANSRRVLYSRLLLSVAPMRSGFERYPRAQLDVLCDWISFAKSTKNKLTHSTHLQVLLSCVDGAQCSTQSSFAACCCTNMTGRQVCQADKLDKYIPCLAPRSWVRMTRAQMPPSWLHNPNTHTLSYVAFRASRVT